MASIKFDAVIETAKIVSGFRDIQEAVHQTSKKVKEEGASIDDVINKIQEGLSFAIGGWSVGTFVNKMMEVRGQFQQTEMAFKTMLQSEEKANELMKQMIHTAAITPFGVEDVTSGAKQLLAFNVAAEDVNKTLIGLGDVAAGMGLNLSDMVMLYGTTIAKGKMDTMDMYQFLNRGIPIADELAKVMGLDVNNAIAEVSKQIKAGKVTSDVFIQAMQSMTSEGSKFGGLMEEQSKTITGQISNIEDAVEQMFNELGRSQEGVINTGLGIVSALVENWETVGKVLMTVVATYGAYKAAVIAMVAIEKARIALNSAQAFLSLARSITSAKDAMALFNLVCSANTLGLVLGVVAAAYTAFKIFGDNTADVAENTKKFGDDASTATKHVESLLAILKTAKQGTKLYTDTVKELSNIYRNYGIDLTKIKEDESNLIDVKDDEIKKSQELIEQIKLESVERNRANAISSANEKYNNRINSAQSSLQQKMEDAYGTSGVGISLGIQNIVSTDVINRYAELSRKMEGLNSKSKEYQMYLREYNNLDGKLIIDAKKLAESFGFNGEQTNKAKKAMVGYFSELRAGKAIYDNELEAINRSADATENLGSKSKTAADRIRETQRQLQKAGEDVHTLYGRVKNFMEEYSENDIKFHVKFDAETPAWMEKMDIPKLGRLGKFFSALAKEMANKGQKSVRIKGTNKKMTLDEVAQRGYDYTKAANDKQTEAEEEAKKKARAKAEAEEAKKKAVADAKKKADDQKKAQEQLNEELKQLEQKNTDDTISLMQEGTAKKLKEIDNDYKKRLAEIDKQEKDFKDKNKVAKKSPALTKEQSNALSEARKLAKQEFDKETAEVNKEALKEETQALYDYLKEFGSIQQQKYVIAKEYDEKIKQAQGENQKKLLEAQKNEALDAMDANNYAMGIDWTSSFQGVGNVLKEIAGETLTKLDAYMKSDNYKKLDATNKKTYADLRKELREQQDKSSSPFKTSTWNEIASLTGTYKESVKKLIAATEDHNSAVAELQAAEKELENASTDAAKEIASAKVTAAQGKVKSTANALNVAQSNKDDAQQNLADKTDDAAKGLDNFSKILSNITSGSLSGFVNGVLGVINSLKGGTNEVGSALGQLGGKIGGLIGAIVQIIDALGDDPAEFIDDLLSRIIDAIDGILTQLANGELAEVIIKDVAKLIGNVAKDLFYELPANGIKISTFGAIDPSGWFSGNEKEVEDAINNLTESNDNLQKAIDNLKDVMSNTYGKESTYAYKEAEERQKEYNKNTLKIAEEQIGYHSSHHSWGYYWDERGGFTEQELSLIREKVKSDFGGGLWDFLQLSPEEMQKMLSYQDIREAIKNTGEGPYGKDVLEKLDDYAALAGKIDELTDDWRESITQISFDSMKESFISNLMDMSKSAEDFADDFAEDIQKALLTYSMEDLINGDLKQLYSDWANLMDKKGGQFDTNDVEDFQARYNAIVEEGIKRRDNFAQITGYTGDSSSSQSATSGGWQSMGQETADELNGRFTALQIAGETIAKDMATNVAQMETIMTLGMSTNGAVLEIRNMMIMTNSYLEDMVKYARQTYNDFGTKMDDMVSSLKKI